MANCAKCGAALLQGAVFCGSCGASVPPPAPAARISPPISMQQGAGFFASLFDFSFTEFITTKMIKFLYVVGMLLAGLLAVVFIIGGFSRGAGYGIAALIFSPLVFLVYVILARVWLEIIIVIFRIAEHTAEIAKQRGQAG